MKEIEVRRASSLWPIVCDIAMPRVNGLAAAASILATHRTRESCSSRSRIVVRSSGRPSIAAHEATSSRAMLVTNSSPPCAPRLKEAAIFPRMLAASSERRAVRLRKREKDLDLQSPRRTGPHRCRADQSSRGTRKPRNDDVPLIEPAVNLGWEIRRVKSALLEEIIWTIVNARCVLRFR